MHFQVYYKKHSTRASMFILKSVLMITVTTNVTEDR